MRMVVPLRPALPSTLLLPFLVVVALATSSSLAAQEAIRYTTTSTFEMGGALGAMVAAFTDSDEAIEETVTVGGGMMRMDSENTSTIMKMAEGRMIEIDHEARTWWTLEFAAAMAEFEGMRDAAAAEPAPQTPEDQPDFGGDFEFERTGRIESIGGLEAEQVIFTLTMEARDEEAEGSPLAGRVALLSEVWMSNELAEHPAFAEMRSDAMEFAQEELGPGMGMGAFGADPRMAEAMETMQEELGGLEGVAVRTTSLFVLLPGDLELDREAALAALGEELSSDGPSLADLAGRGAADAARSALGGLFGRRSEPEEPEEPELVQQSLMRMVQEIGEVESIAFDASLFDPPADYTEVESPLAAMRRR
jgi:hypothetical protein